MKRSLQWAAGAVLLQRRTSRLLTNKLPALRPARLRGVSFVSGAAMQQPGGSVVMPSASVILWILVRTGFWADVSILPGRRRPGKRLQKPVNGWELPCGRPRPGPGTGIFQPAA